MTDKTSRILGIATGVIGIALLVLNAVDYLAGWDSIHLRSFGCRHHAGRHRSLVSEERGEQPEK